ncbi:MAG: hypothetical protein ACJ72A_12280 [Nocardioidaceae bacterium]
MRALGVVLAMLVVAGCGSDSGSDPAEATGYRGCTTGDVAGQGKVVAKADLDGADGPETVRLIGATDRRCGNSLVADVGGRLVGTDVSRLHLVPQGAKVVHLRGKAAADLVLLWSEPHPRGGSQPRLFGLRSAGGLTEVTLDGQPVLPFVATDGGGSPMTATCTRSGGIAVWSAVAHEPPGIVLAWDVRRSTYDVRDGRAVAVGSSLVEEAAADPALRRSRPELFSGELFGGCG